MVPSCLVGEVGLVDRQEEVEDLVDREVQEGEEGHHLEEGVEVEDRHQEELEEEGEVDRHLVEGEDLGVQVGEEHHLEELGEQVQQVHQFQWQR